MDSPREGRLISLIAHDIRNALNAINMSVHMIEGQLPPSDEELRSDFRMLDESVTNLRRMLFVLTDYAEVVESHDRPSNDRFDARALLRTVAEEIRGGDADGPPILLDIADTFPESVSLDPRMARTALKYALSNAVHAAEGGEVRVHADAAGDRWSVTIRDANPSPMESAAFDLAREPMQRLMSNHRERRGGDLAIVAHVVDKLGGTARLATRQGQGGELVLDLPVCGPL